MESNLSILLRAYVADVLVDVILEYLMQNVWDNNSKLKYLRPAIRQWNAQHSTYIKNKPKGYFFHHPSFTSVTDKQWICIQDKIWIWVKHKCDQRLWVMEESKIEEVTRYCIQNKLFHPKLDVR